MDYWARLEDGFCAEVINHDPERRYHPDISWAKIPPALVSWTDRHYTVTNGIFSAPIEHVLSQVIGQAAAARYDIENQSVLQITLQNGTSLLVPTCREIRFILIPALTAATKRTSSSFKINNVWVSLTAQDATNLIDNICNYVQSLYDREHAIVNHITGYATNLTDSQEDIIKLISEYRNELSTGWPQKEITHL
jgi:hypothetical protein